MTILESGCNDSNNKNDSPYFYSWVPKVMSSGDVKTSKYELNFFFCQIKFSGLRCDLRKMEDMLCAVGVRER